MTIYFSWACADDIFSTCHHKNMESIFSLEIVHDEGEFAKAHIYIKNPFVNKKYPPDSYECIFLSTRLKDGTVHCLFKGYLSGTQAVLKDNLVKLIFTAQPRDYLKKLEQLEEKLKKIPYWDPLFSSQDFLGSLSAILKARPSVIYWDRTTGELSLSHLFYGRKHCRVDKFFYMHSLKIETIYPPLARVDVTLEAQWIQQIRGYTNVSHHIRRKFPELIINTFTGKNFRSSWPKTGKTLSRSGYWVAVSHLEEVYPDAVSGSDVGGASSSPLWTSHEGEEKVHKVYAKRFWFEGKLILGWDYRQKRVEKLHFTLRNDLQPFFCKGAQRVETIHINLGNISPESMISFWTPHFVYDLGFKMQYQSKVYRCVHAHTSGDSFSENSNCWRFEEELNTALGDPSRSSFFLIDRGVKAFEYGLEMAQTYLAKKSRPLMVSFSGSWEQLCHLTLDHTVSLFDPRLPGEKVKGKVSKLLIKAEGETGERFVTIILSVSVGTGKDILQDEKPKEIENFCEHSYVQTHYLENFSCLKKTSRGRRYHPYRNQVPEEIGLQINSQNMLKDLSIINCAQDQESYLKKRQYPHGAITADILNHKKTKIFLKLKSLRSLEERCHNITVKLPYSWASPKQVSFPI